MAHSASRLAEANVCACRSALAIVASARSGRAPGAASVDAPPQTILASSGYEPNLLVATTTESSSGSTTEGYRVRTASPNDLFDGNASKLLVRPQPPNLPPSSYYCIVRRRRRLKVRRYTLVDSVQPRTTKVIPRPNYSSRLPAEDYHHDDDQTPRHFGPPVARPSAYR